jgi:hypothetical protein
MKKIRQNPALKIWGLTLLIAGMLLSWWLGPGPASIVNIAGLLLAFTGIDTELSDDGVKLGFTKITTDEVADVYEDTEGVIVLVTRDRHRYRLKRWHYRFSEWSRVREHVFGLIRTQNKPCDATGDMLAS